MQNTNVNTIPATFSYLNLMNDENWLGNLNFKLMKDITPHGLPYVTARLEDSQSKLGYIEAWTDSNTLNFVVLNRSRSVPMAELSFHVKESTEKVAEKLHATLKHLCDLRILASR